jgi:hypothetical protein
MGICDMKSNFSFILFLILYLPVLANQDLKIIKSDKNSIVVEFTPIYDDTSLIYINNKKFIKVSFFDGILQSSEAFGMPEILMKKISVGVPAEFGNTI